MSQSSNFSERMQVNESPHRQPHPGTASQVANDQISKIQDALHPWFLVPTGTAVLVLVAASVALAVMRRDDPEKKTKPSPGGIMAIVSIGVSILVMIVMSIILAIRHPRATAEQMATRSLVSWLK